ncbi:flagellar assembly protein FliH [Gracilibacillus alcaliphilus]|uniref:flagellar assembly protein FliH n=1 Tax=Gracilibacillus alcaliphilus TaxID=1401441 RepID=UPI00195C1ACE|nr:flagellar assembly protein FliH [Gracilibacillus alcaliphilus]MBM7677933.1 flagellar assembly protein FliH [Gracilibacillus alcaliphilus]
MSDYSIPLRDVRITKQEPDQQPVNEQEAVDQIEKQIQKKQQELHDLQQKITIEQEQAMQKMESWRSNWEQERISYVEQAQQEGYQQGFDQGKKDSYHQFQQLLDQAQETLFIAKKEYQRIISESDETIIHIALAVAEKVLHTELTENKEQFFPVAQALIHQVKDHPEIKLYVPNEVYPMFVEQKEELAAIVHHQAGFSIYPIMSENKQQIMIETPFGKVDASIDSQLDEIRNHLSKVTEEITSECHESVE